jgi:hypothetical protein
MAVGWLLSAPCGALTPPTHKVAVLRTLVFPPPIKLAPVEALPGARVAVAQRGRLRKPPRAVVPAVILRRSMRGGGLRRRRRKISRRAYLWGGKTSFGLDCSALVQVALALADRLPRDSDLQEQAIGVLVTGYGSPICGAATWCSGAAMSRSGDAATLIHANAFHMAVAIEPVAEALARAATGSEPTSVRRLVRSSIADDAVTAFERKAEFAAVDLAEHVGHDYARDARRGAVRRGRHLRMGPERARHRQRLVREHVERRAREEAVVERDEDVGVNL